MAACEAVWLKRILKDLTSLYCDKMKIIVLQHIYTNLQTVDIFTKALGADKLWQFMIDLGLTIPDLPSLRGSTVDITQ